MSTVNPNAADKRQVRHAERREKDRRAQELADLKALLDEPAFRRFAWRLMGFCAWGENPARPRGDETHQIIGMQNVARYLISEIGEAGGIDAWLLMQREAWAAKQKEKATEEAVRTDSADQSGHSTRDGQTGRSE
jgi:hypothetical protein